MVENEALVVTCARKDVASDGTGPVQLCSPVKPGDRPTSVGFVSVSTWSSVGRPIVPALLTVKVAEGPAAGAALPARSLAVPEAMLMPRVPVPVIAEIVTVREAVPVPVT